MVMKATAGTPVNRPPNPQTPNPNPTPRSASNPVEDLKKVKQELDGAVTILQQEFKKNAANAGKVDTVALSNACNQLQATSQKIAAILSLVDKP